MDVKEFEQLDAYGKRGVLSAYNSYQSDKLLYNVIKGCVAGSLILIVSMMAGCPQYNVWAEGLKGKAELKRAEQSRQIKIEEAKALKESATYKRDAEIIRAEGIDGANKIIADGLGGPQGYLRYLYIDALQATNCKTIYIPTEAGLPILEAGRH